MGRGLGLGSGAGSVSPFAVLDLDEEASLTEVKKKFHELAKEHHPDKRGGSTASKRNFQRLGEALACLDTEEKLKAAKRQVQLAAPRRRAPAKPASSASTQAAPEVTYTATGAARNQMTDTHKVDIRA